MRNKDEILRDKQALDNERDKYRDEVMDLLQGLSSGKYDAIYVDERMTEINTRMLEMVVEMNKLVDEARELNSQIENYNIIV